MKKLLALLLLLPALAFALDYEAGIGMSFFQYAHDGSTWYQDPFPHTLKLNSPSAALGVSDKWKDFRWHADYLWLGRVTSNAIAATGPDFNYEYPKAHFSGSGYVHGFHLSTEYEREVGGMTLGFGPGLYLYRSSWQVDIPDWQACFSCPVTPLHVVHAPKWQNTPTISFTVRQGQHSIVGTYLHHVTAEGDQYPALYDIYRSGFMGKLGLPGMWSLNYRYIF